jgi:hypothetical protein
LVHSGFEPFFLWCSPPLLPFMSFAFVVRFRCL